MHAGIHVPYRATKPKLAEYIDIAPIGLISTVAEPTRRTHTGAPACVYGPAGFVSGVTVDESPVRTRREPRTPAVRRGVASPELTSLTHQTLRGSSNGRRGRNGLARAGSKGRKNQGSTRITPARPACSTSPSTAPNPPVALAAYLVPNLSTSPAPLLAREGYLWTSTRRAACR